MITPTATDVSLLLSLNGDGGATLDFLMYYASQKLTWLPLYALLLWMVWRKEGSKNLLKFIVITAVMILVADQTSNLAKTFLPKFRPTHTADLQTLIHTVGDYRGGLYGTISSHAANSFALFVLCGAIFKRWWVWLSLALWAVVVSYSRIYLAVHFPFDVIIGMVVGVAVGALAAWTYNKWKNKRHEQSYSNS